VKPKKFKTYVALSVYLCHVPKKHVAANGSRQFNIVCKAHSQQRVADLVGAQLSGIRHMGIMVTDNEKHIAACEKPERIYYKMDNLNPEGKDDFGRWFEYLPLDVT
jgi:predicted component of type VI protein secretion system